MKNINKKDSPCVLKKTVVFGILLLIIIGATMVSEISTKAADDVEWELKLKFDEPGGKYDYVVFGETPDANDGLSPDSYDMPKPPAPMTPFIRAWLNDNLTEPYNLLIADYRKYPDIHKVWNLTVLWLPSDFNASTTINISWNTSNITNLEYDSIEMYRAGNSNPVTDILMDTKYSFICPANEAQHFQIICQGGTSNGKTDTNEISFLYLILIIALIIICLLILYWKIIRR